MIKNAVALVTWHASSLGRVTVEHLAKQGARVVMTDLGSSKSNEIAKELGDNVVFVPVNITFEKDVTTALETANDIFGPLNLVVNCDGTTTGYCCWYDFANCRHVSTQDIPALPEKVHTFSTKTIPFPQSLGEPSEYAHLVQAIYENPLMNRETIRIDGGLRIQT
ncbi:3-hydroxyacyl-CoA dehydrogenase type-2-like [Musca autumnalis]|uniref:3-hydroxyacyl-CoA dehydrogenase type-2-like n=1 Tax=Musca autumnalis TaxID=221902 RepID=UPI003CF809D0